MSFPIRPTRSSFGPTLENARPVMNPRREIPQESFNALFWSLAGLAQMSPIAWVLIAYATGAISLEAHAEAWNPDGTLPGPDIEKTGTGLYVVTYDAEYPDEQGVDRPLVLSHGLPVVQGLTSGGGAPPIAWTTKLSAVSFQIDIIQATAPTFHDDANVLALFW